MKIIKNITFEEYIYWYLDREFTTKEDRYNDNPEKFKTIEEMKAFMAEHHSGKIRDWFPFAKYFQVEISDINFLDTFICLHSDALWIQELIPSETVNKVNFRILETVIKNVHENNYFRSGCSDHDIRHKYYNRFKDLEKLPPLKEKDKIVLCSLNISEKINNPSASYYLHDGLGRLLTYSYLNKHKGKEFSLPIEAVVIEKINL